jgi:hypothetical protein
VPPVESRSRGRLGTLIYEEPARDFEARRRSHVYTGAAFAGLGIASLYVFLLSPTSNPVPAAFCIVAPIVGLCGLLATAGLAARRYAAPFRVHALGFSMGKSVEDRVLFKDVAHAETWRRIDGVEYLMVTLRTGRAITVTGSPLAKNASARLRDYDRAKKALMSQYDIGGVHEVLWESAAKELVGDLDHFKGPVRAAAERVALKEGRRTVDLGFLIKCKEEIRKEAWPYGREFGLRMARNGAHTSARA